MKQEQIKLEIIKRFTNSLEINNDKIITTLDEDDYYEFKKTLHVGNSGISKNYLKTISSFANNKGGLIIFGIDPDTQELVGINSKHENLDNKYVNMVVSEMLDGMGSFYFFTNKHYEKIIGFLIINEPTFKPVIFKSNFNTKESSYVAGDIYFRYPGESMKIKPSDLRSLISNEITRHAEQLISQISKLVEIGPENVAIINSKTGEINANNSRLSLSPDILADLNLIMEGNIVEKDGAPAYVIKGNIEIENNGHTTKIIKEKTSLHNRDYHLSILDDETSNPESLINEIVYRDTSNLPFFNLIHKSNYTIQQTIDILEKLVGPDIKKSTKNKILERLTNPNSCQDLGEIGKIESIINDKIMQNIDFLSFKEKYNLKGKYEKTLVRTLIFNTIKDKIEVETVIVEKYFKEYIEAFSHISFEIDDDYQFYKTELNKILTNYNLKLTNDNQAKTAFRKTLCYMDYKIYFPKLN